MKKLLFILIILSIFGCSKGKEESVSSEPEPVLNDEKSQTGKNKLLINDRKIIKEGEIYFESSNFAETRKQIDKAIEKYEAYISKEDEHTYDERIVQSMVIRVPAENFDKLVTEISKGTKKFETKRIEVKDVTEEYFDIETRLKVKKETENRYRELLTQAKTVKDILEIEKQIGELRAEIESIEGRLRYLQDRISYSTLTVDFYERISIPVGFFSKFRVGLKNGWNNFVWFLLGLVNIWPFIILGLFCILGLFKLRRMRKAKKSNSEVTMKNEATSY